MEEILKTLTINDISSLKYKRLKKGELLFSENDICEYIGIVKTGEIIIVSYLEDGKEIIYNSINANGVFGNNLIFSSDQRYRGDVIAKVETELYLINKENLIKILQTNQKFLLVYLNLQSDFGKELNLKIKLLTFNNAKERIEYYLQANGYEIRYKTITELAQTLYLSREVLSRTLHEMERSNEISISDKKIVKI